MTKRKNEQSSENQQAWKEEQKNKLGDLKMFFENDCYATGLELEEQLNIQQFNAKQKKELKVNTNEFEQYWKDSQEAIKPSQENTADVKAVGETEAVTDLI